MGTRAHIKKAPAEPEVCVRRRPERDEREDARDARSRATGVHMGDSFEASVSRDDIVRE